MALFIAVSCTFLINIIFGYWRANTRKFSLPWILAIHIPVPITVGLRFALLGWNWILIPAFVLDFTAGQFVGGKLRSWMAKQSQIPLSSFLLADVRKALVARRNKKIIAP